MCIRKKLSVHAKAIFAEQKQKNMNRNYKLILGALTLLGSSLIKAQAPTPDLFHYKFNGTGSLVTNYASAPPAGTSTGTMLGSITQTGAVNCMGALVGSGISSTTDYLNTNWAPNIGTGAWTMSFWTSSITPSSTLFYIVGDVNTASFRMFTNGVAGANNWILRGAGLTDILLNGAATMTPNLVSFVYSPTFSTVVGYINGVPTTTVTQTGTVNLTGAGPLKVGGYSSNVGFPAGGMMADFRLYSSALTASDVASVYNEGIAMNLSALGNSTICPGQNASLSAAGATSYTWNTGAFTNSITVTPTTSTTYTVMGTAGTCSATATVSVNVLSTPVITVNNGTICTGSSFTINPSGASTYTIQGGNAVVSPNTTSSYSVVGTGTNGCISSTATSSVLVNNLPSVSAASSSTLICVGQTASITASGATAYVWNTTATTAVIAVSPTTTTSYTVTGTDANNCAASFTISQAVSACTGIENNSLSNNISVSPNPTSGVFMLTLFNGFNTIVIADISGRVVMSTTSTEPQVLVNLNNYANGVYFITVKNNNTLQTTKVVKH